MQEKIELRRAIKERLTRMSENDRRVESQIIVRELRKMLPESMTTIAVYFPYLDEPDIQSLVAELLEQKNVICLPKAEMHGMTMHRIRSLDDVQKNPVTGIFEPIEPAPLDETTIAIVIIPGRAFLRTGERLGRGNGGYDRWISDQRKRNPETRFIGVCFDCQIVQEMPTEQHDEKVDVVLSATEFKKA
ncbi:5-formyltetrahydrofolate cyclo-ligase [Candidatus Peribacteria bacterium]|nr:5-formyltetrahydrofolate cyclo-ligase [Candidatus Peribacteria bacterium]